MAVFVKSKQFSGKRHAIHAYILLLIYFVWIFLTVQIAKYPGSGYIYSALIEKYKCWP